MLWSLSADKLSFSIQTTEEMQKLIQTKHDRRKGKCYDAL